MPQVTLSRDLLHPYQKAGVAWLKERKRAILADEMGLGKSVQALFAAADCVGPGGRILVVCPKSVKGVWSSEASKWLGERTVAYEGDKRARDAVLREFASQSEPRILVIGYEQLRLDERALSDSKMKWAAIVFDEAHRLKNHRAKTFKAANRLCLRFKEARVYMLTGTPIMNRLSEIWTLLHITDPKAYPSFWRWVEENMRIETVSIPGSPPFRKIGPPKNCSLSMKKLEGVVLRREARNLLDLPPIRHIRVPLTMPKEQRRIYDQMKKKWFAEIGGVPVVSATTVLAQLTRLRQICLDPGLVNPYCYTAGANEPAKTGYLMDWFGDRGWTGRTVVFCTMPSYLRILRARMEEAARVAGENGFLTEAIDGDTETQDRIAAISRFQACEHGAMLVSMHAGAEGISLTAAEAVVVVDQPWNPAILDQAIARVHRQGLDHAVTVYHLDCTDTVDTKILRMIREKRFVFDHTIPTTAFGLDEWV